MPWTSPSVPPRRASTRLSGPATSPTSSRSCGTRTRPGHRWSPRVPGAASPVPRWRSRAASCSTSRRWTPSPRSTRSRDWPSPVPASSTPTSRPQSPSTGSSTRPTPPRSAFCTIGGNVATNAGGLCCVKYGVTADYIRGLQVVLPGGEVIRTGHRTAKGVAGLDLTGLFVGSEGTLGVVTEIVAKVVPAPDPALTVLATFDSLEPASLRHRRPAPRAPRAEPGRADGPRLHRRRAGPRRLRLPRRLRGSPDRAVRPARPHRRGRRPLCRDPRQGGGRRGRRGRRRPGGRPAARRPPGPEPGPGGQGRPGSSRTSASRWGG